MLLKTTFFRVCRTEIIKSVKPLGDRNTRFSQLINNSEGSAKWGGVQFCSTVLFLSFRCNTPFLIFDIWQSDIKLVAKQSRIFSSADARLPALPETGGIIIYYTIALCYMISDFQPCKENLLLYQIKQRLKVVLKPAQRLEVTTQKENTIFPNKRRAYRLCLVGRLQKAGWRHAQQRLQVMLGWVVPRKKKDSTAIHPHAQR